jgi:hypothetical protein
VYTRGLCPMNFAERKEGKAMDLAGKLKSTCPIGFTEKLKEGLPVVDFVSAI